MAPAQAWREMRPGKRAQWMLLGSWMILRDEGSLLAWRMRAVRVLAVKKRSTGNEIPGGNLILFDCVRQRHGLCLFCFSTT